LLILNIQINIMKKKILCVFIGLFCFAIGTVSAQFSNPVSIGLGAGGTFSVADLPNERIQFAFYGELDYLITPFISIGLHGEKGKLSGNGDNSNFENNYYVGHLNGKVRVGEFMGLPENYSYYTLQASTLSRVLSNIYIGIGAGLIKNGIKTQLTADYAKRIGPSGGEIIRDPSGIYPIIPLNLGIDIPIGRTLYGPQWAVNVNYQHILTIDDNVDGITYLKNDQYGFISLGVKYGLFNRK